MLTIPLFTARHLVDVAIALAAHAIALFVARHPRRNSLLPCHPRSHCPLRHPSPSPLPPSPYSSPSLARHHCRRRHLPLHHPPTLLTSQSPSSSPAIVISVAIALAPLAIALFVACHRHCRCYCPCRPRNCPLRRPPPRRRRHCPCCRHRLPATLVAITIALATLAIALLVACHLADVAIAHVIAVWVLCQRGRRPGGAIEFNRPAANCILARIA
jgi:hypothetical protein